MPRKNINHRGRVNISSFYCTSCGKQGIYIPRKPGKEREPGHLKKLYCIYCKEEKNMVEIRQNGKYTLEDFQVEYKYGNFTSTGDRMLPYKDFKILAAIGKVGNKK